MIASKPPLSLVNKPTGTERKSRKTSSCKSLKYEISSKFLRSSSLSSSYSDSSAKTSNTSDGLTLPNIKKKSANSSKQPQRSLSSSSVFKKSTSTENDEHLYSVAQ